MHADDIQATGPLPLGLAAIQLVKEQGPAYGIRLNTAKTKIVVKRQDLTRAQDQHPPCQKFNKSFQHAT